MVAKKGTSQDKVGDLGVGRSNKLTERGYFGQALREGRVRQPSPEVPRIVNMLLWVLNVVVWLLAAAFAAWRLYAVYLV